jgi:hypothetical protein
VRLCFFFVALLGLVACSPKHDDPPPNNGVNDVKAACQIRTAWKTPTADKCALCVASAPLADCGCEATHPFAAMCVQQGDALRSEPSCTSDLQYCRAKCANDCACVDNCYANAPKCKPLVAAEDGCIADVCTAYCNGPDAGPP